MRKIGINLHAIQGLTDREYIQTIASLGFTATFSGSLMNDKQRVTKLAEVCATYGVTYETMHAPFKHINDIWLPGEDGDAMLQELYDCVDSCAAAGVGIAVVHLSSGEVAPSITDLGRERFARLVDRAAEKGVTIAFENQRKLANLAWSLETFGSEVAGFCWDCGHEGCFTPGRQYMPLFSDRLICTHLHDNNGIYNEDRHVLPFDGNLDFERVARQIKESGYTGSLMLEVFADAEELYGDMTPHRYLERAAKAATRLAEMVG